MPEARTAGTGGEALSLEQQWTEAETDLRRCLAEIHQAETGSANASAPAPLAKAAPSKLGKRVAKTGRALLEKAHIPLSSKAIPKKPVDLLLGLLLRAMHAKFAVDAEYRKNIKNFTAQYVFKDKTAKICQVAHFANGKMKVGDKEPENATFTLIFRDGKALLALLFSPAPDVLNALLNQEVDFTGNINYLNKFAYMALLAKPHF